MQRGNTMSGNEQDLRASIDQALRKASLSLFAQDQETLLRTAILLREQAAAKAAPKKVLAPA
ncbi:hypothetical protein EAH89_21620 [Roseomonas nepalensis]|uniref:Uncharacterized protein n=2 Tax=Muricoccus nepalensis TaxID=1854500 RepID=A0A502FIR8_9PROT|nr:hypothetical protein EAH89_21620 [Roseomonas nepalensis]